MQDRAITGCRRDSCRPESQPGGSNGRVAPCLKRLVGAAEKFSGSVYLGSVDFKALDERTQCVRRRALELTWDEPSSNDDAVTYATCPVGRMDARLIRVLRDRKADVPESANMWLKAIRAVFAWANEVDHVAGNPAREVNRNRNPVTLVVAEKAYASGYQRRPF